MLASRWLTARREPQTLFVSVLLGGLIMFAIGWSPLWYAALGLMVVEGLSEGFASVAEQGLLQRRTPDDVRSRVAGAVEAATLIALAVSLTLGGHIVDWLGPRAAYYLRARDPGRSRGDARSDAQPRTAAPPDRSVLRVPAAGARVERR